MNETQILVIGTATIVGVVSFFLGYSIGASSEETRLTKEAREAGVGQWVVDQDTQILRFVFRK